MDTLNQNLEYGFGLISDHLAGSSSVDLQKQLDEWRHASNENEQLYVWMEQMWRTLSLSEHDKTFDSQRAYLLFCQRVEAETGKIRKAKIKPYRLLLRIASVAAVLIPLFILSYFTYRYFAISPEQTKAPLLSEITVPAGSKIQMSLQDGTKVWLNADSHLQYNSDFGFSNRTLSLSGEAYFEVAKDERSPFIVNVGGIKIKVHGTHFNVNSYKENDGVAVTLLEGSVEMITSKSNTILQPGNMARYDAITGKIAIATNNNSIPDKKLSNVNVINPKAIMTKTNENAIDWINNRLIFNGESFEQIIATLERNYNVKVNIHNDQIKKRRFAGDFTNNETIEQIFTVMSFNGKFLYEINGNIIDLY